MCVSLAKKDAEDGIKYCRGYKGNGKISRDKKTCPLWRGGVGEERCCCFWYRLLHNFRAVDFTQTVALPPVESAQRKLKK